MYMALYIATKAKTVCSCHKDFTFKISREGEQVTHGAELYQDLIFISYATFLLK